MIYPKKHFPALLFMLIFFITDLSAQSGPDGAYTGKLEIQGTSIEMIFEFVQDEQGSGKNCLLSIPQQNLSEFKADDCIVTDSNLIVSFNAFAAKFVGSLDEKGNIQGTWNQGGLVANLVLQPAEGGISAMRPQEPKPPFPYEIQEFAIPNPDAPGVTLSGTLTKPLGEGPFPLVVLISGSGPQNRNSEIFGHKPFWVIADYLTKHGIGVFRYDDRGIGASTGNFQAATTADLASDTKAIVSALKKQEKRAQKIGLIGHSEGGIIAPIVANQSKDVDFLVLLAGPALPGDEILLAQTGLILEKSGTSPDGVRKQTDYARKVYDLVKQTPMDQPLDYDALKKLTKSFYDQADETIKSQYGTYEKFYFTQSSAMSSPWMRYFITYDPAPALEQLNIPVFALYGSLDIQVPARENMEKMQEALAHLPEGKARILEVPGMNHLFQAADTGLPGEYGSIRETFNEGVLQSITSWILHLSR